MHLGSIRMLEKHSFQSEKSSPLVKLNRCKKIHCMFRAHYDVIMRSSYMYILTNSCLASHNRLHKRNSYKQTFERPEVSKAKSKTRWGELHKCQGELFG